MTRRNDEAPRTLAGAVLVAPAAVTHGNDMYQRLVRLPIAASDGAIAATVPPFLVTAGRDEKR